MSRHVSAGLDRSAGYGRDMVQLSDQQSERLRRMFDEWLPHWADRAGQNQTVEPGSSLHGDDEALQGLRCSHTAWMGLVASIDHLQALRDLWMASRTLHAFADNTLLRSAVLTASTCVYLLDDAPGVTRQDRCRRAALAAIDEARDELRFHQAIQPMAAGLGAEAVAVGEANIARLVELEEQATAVAKHHGATAKEVRSGLLAHRCVSAAADLLARTSPEEEAPMLAVGVRTLWQQGSADAHGRLWQWGLGDREGSSVMASMDEVFNGLQAAFLIVNQAWRLWDLRSRNQTGHPVAGAAPGPVGPGASFVKAGASETGPAG